jgi:hypothetical protein
MPSAEVEKRLELWGTASEVMRIAEAGGGIILQHGILFLSPGRIPIPGVPNAMNPRPELLSLISHVQSKPDFEHSMMEWMFTHPETPTGHCAGCDDDMVTSPTIGLSAPHHPSCFVHVHCWTFWHGEWNGKALAALLGAEIRKAQFETWGGSCAIAKWCLNHDCGRLNEKQRAFLRSMARCRRPSEKQMAWLVAIEKKLAQALSTKTDPDGPGAMVPVPSKTQRNILEALHEGDKLEKVGRHYWLFGGPFGGGGFGIRPRTVLALARNEWIRSEKLERDVVAYMITDAGCAILKQTERG